MPSEFASCPNTVGMREVNARHFIFEMAVRADLHLFVTAMREMPWTEVPRSYHAGASVGYDYVKRILLPSPCAPALRNPCNTIHDDTCGPPCLSLFSVRTILAARCASTTTCTTCVMRSVATLSIACHASASLLQLLSLPWAMQVTDSQHHESGTAANWRLFKY